MLWDSLTKNSGFWVGPLLTHRYSDICCPRVCRISIHNIEFQGLNCNGMNTVTPYSKPPWRQWVCNNEKKYEFRIKIELGYGPSPTRSVIFVSVCVLVKQRDWIKPVNHSLKFPDFEGLSKEVFCELFSRFQIAWWKSCTHLR